MGAFVNTEVREIPSFRHIRLSDIFNRQGAKVAKISSFSRFETNEPEYKLPIIKVEGFAEGNGYVIVAIRATVTGYLIQSILLILSKKREQNYLGPFKRALLTLRARSLIDRHLTLPHPENQVNDEPDERNGGDNKPHCFFPEGSKVFLGCIQDGPDGSQ